MLTLRSTRLGLRISNRLSFGEGSGYFFIAAVMLTKIQILHILFSDASDEASWEIRSFVPRPTPPKDALFLFRRKGERHDRRIWWSTPKGTRLHLRLRR
jgi:hypothetical protein